ncbi:ABC transporter permease [Schnuerera sp.]|uniref:ABC transporter permease n=1 Tax=Schnuerera sp. TaxID=2794844 RepID=UPI002C74C374|nr:ABC transporter permease [Schnuerera sp.]HSH35100.1 ABC transporter permease [Schnuerera sp.]
MYSNFIKYEIKKWSRDSMMGFMAMYPFIFGLIGRYMLPWIAEKSDFSIDLYADLIIVILTLMVPISFGALIAFSILEDRDDNILTSVKVTPLSINQFLSFRFFIVLVLAYITTVFVIWFSDIGNIPLKNIFAISLLASLEAPMYGLLINSLSNNKIEGFAVMKGFGIFMIFPIIALFFIDKKELFFSFAPGFWAAKSISSIIRGEGVLYLSYYQYYFIGILYLILLNIGAFKLFKRKVEI